jgi:3-phenylpropionate/cinnamic acid dioxygenase small subunit
MEEPVDPLDEAAWQATRLYPRQSRLIDEGDAAGWAATFTTDGEFHSPSYPAPCVGTAELTAFAERYAAGQRGGTVSRHVVTNVDVLPGADDAHLLVHAYLQIVATPRGAESRLVRLTTITDRLVRVDGSWLVAHRQVLRDDA